MHGHRNLKVIAICYPLKIALWPKLHNLNSIFRDFPYWHIKEIRWAEVTSEFHAHNFCTWKITETRAVVNDHFKRRNMHIQRNFIFSVLKCESPVLLPQISIAFQKYYFCLTDMKCIKITNIWGPISYEIILLVQDLSPKFCFETGNESYRAKLILVLLCQLQPHFTRTSNRTLSSTFYFLVERAVWNKTK